uniref:Pyrroline-5-carboxylate reductase n=1 Tax=Aegilops tauschii TaxID=37682 RepID=M8B0L3_AEGTA
MTLVSLQNLLMVMGSPRPKIAVEIGKTRAILGDEMVEILEITFTYDQIGERQARQATINQEESGGIRKAQRVVDDSDVIVISVKPQIVKQVLVELKPLLSEEKLLVSIAAGIKMKDLQDWSGQRRIIRVMPNTPSAVGQAASVMCLGETATENDENRVKSLFSAIGKVWTAEEKYFDAVTGLSGSGPAYIFLAIEAMADGGVAAGLPRDLALGLAAQTVLGAATMVSETGKHPGQLKDQVTSPAGTTIAGVHELEKGSFRGTLINAVVAATTRCRELSKN